MDTLALLCIFLGISAVYADGECPPSWAYNGNSCYLFIERQMSWEKAAEVCRSYDKGHLVTVDSADEHQFVLKLLHNSTVTDGYVWLDGSDKREKGKWIWVDSEKELIYTNWGKTEPNNSFGNEHCLSIWFCGDCVNTWNDLDCDLRARPVCEMPSKYAILMG